MLSRSRLRHVAIGSIKDEKHPFGPDCECVGPIDVNCDGNSIDIYDSPTGWLGDRLTEDGVSDSSFPALAVYVDDETADFTGDFEGQLRATQTLVVEIYVSGQSDYGAEDKLDTLQERIMYRLFRQEPIYFEEQAIGPLFKLSPQRLRTTTERSANGDRRIFIRSLEITVQQNDCFDVPDCGPDNPACFEVTTKPSPTC